ncbi:MAG: cyclic pyranopterin monophosphate synthase MoaC [Rudaea sp.]
MELSHVDAAGRARMVDIGGKPDTERVAVARGEVLLKPETLALIQSGRVPKGDVFAVARVAGIMAAKRTPELIPMCHPLLLTDVEIRFETLSEGGAGERARIGIEATAKNVGKTGVEMEALVAVANAALTVYDMVKAVDRGVRVDNIRLVYKAGGKSGEIRLEE